MSNSELIERLRRRSNSPAGSRRPSTRELEAANAIEALEARVKELEGALSDIANAHGLGPATDIMAVHSLANACQSRARTALGDNHGQG